MMVLEATQEAKGDQFVYESFSGSSSFAYFSSIAAVHLLFATLLHWKSFSIRMLIFSISKASNSKL